ncbi:MAG: hypothetical protein RLZZ338_3956, partial [Cyanobacteriota bacterium]
MRSRDWG